jgi:hypothetical protein
LARAVRPRLQPPPPLELSRHDASGRSVHSQREQHEDRTRHAVLVRIAILRRPQPDQSRALERRPLLGRDAAFRRHPPRDRNRHRRLRDGAGSREEHRLPRRRARRGDGDEQLGLGPRPRAQHRGAAGGRSDRFRGARLCRHAP